MSVTFMNSDEPNFIWKNLNALIDMECIIESELPDILPNKRYETYSVVGRNGELTETFNDYEPFDFEIKDISVPYDRLQEVKRWLTGKSKLITHNDEDKYLDAVCSMSKAVSFENEWGCFYKFDVVFRCQPLKKRVNEPPKIITSSRIDFTDSGDELAHPYFEIDSKGGNLSLTIGVKTILLQNTLTGMITVDTELGKAMQEGAPLFTRGDWPTISPGKNRLIVSGNFQEIKLWNRSVYL
ncbi:phage tail protein [Candidatus Enterococcus huntleyi]|uniref:phage tail protein n=1 Tax=Candidatus Enterococcus huntleyi TaxID=1857217 RepID=UPI001F365DD9|nr:phage tail protein [Enterococcus sp. JM4C]